MGKIVVELTHSSNKRNVDLFVRISEVNTKGRSYGVSDTYMRLQPGGSSEVVHLELRDCAHRFAEGNRLRLIVAGASHPHNGINLEKAVHTIHHGETGMSRIRIPCLNVGFDSTQSRIHDQAKSHSRTQFWLAQTMRRCLAITRQLT
jgi:predicted acyl esterase